MPLPPAPAKRAALLNTEGLETASTKSRNTRKSSTRAEPRQTAEQATSKVRETTTAAAPRKSEPMPSYKRESERKTMPARSASPKKKHTGPTKLFVLDTNVLMHDPMCLFRFEEHDVFLPMIVLEELDGHKKGCLLYTSDAADD